jgi:sialate O-acetylesterase
MHLKKCFKKKTRNWFVAALAIIFMSGASASASVVFDFNDGTGLDNQNVGASMVVSNIAITTVDIIGQDGSRSSNGAGHKTNIYWEWNALGINDAIVTGNEYGSFDSGEAWEFTFDADVYLSEIDLSGQGPGAELTISSAAFADIVLPYVDSAAIHDLGTIFVPSGTLVIFDMTSPTDAADTSLRISTLTIEAVTVPSTSTDSGTPYAWLDTFYTGLVAAVDYENADTVDSDGDGLEAWAEYQAGTIPTNPASVLAVESVAVAGGDCIVSWQSVTGKSYRVLSSPGLPATGWTTKAHDIAGLTVQTSHTCTVSAAAAAFYKVRLFSEDLNIDLPRFISSDMVLQRNQPIRLWGWAPPGETVEAVLDREGSLFSTEAIADSTGRWDLALPQQAVCTHACTLTFRIPGVAASELVLTNILIGDVWLASGQSNMEKKVGHLIEAAAITALADQYPQIRSFRSPYNVQYEPADRVNPAATPWQVVDSSNVGSGVSAVAYCFALKVHTEVNVPIGLLQGYRGGTEIETWMSDETIQTHPDLDSVRAREKVWDQNDPKAYSTHYSVNFNGQIHPLVGLSIKGVVWYQGESNTKRAYEYARVQKAMIEGWRAQWGIGDFHFLYVQLFNMGPTSSDLYVENNWCDLRDQQLSLLSAGITNVAMAVTIDTNEDPNNSDASIRIHPKNKKPIGDRLGLLALKNVYGQDIVAKSPQVDLYSIQGSNVVVGFKQVGTGLKMKDGDVALKGFVVAGADQVFYEATAVFVDGQTVSLSSAAVPSPVTARYGWAKNPDCNLYNSADLPASPFRLDAWPSGYTY